MQRQTPPKALDKDKRALTVELYDQKKLSLKKICELMGISKPTLYAYVRESQQRARAA